MVHDKETTEETKGRSYLSAYT